jgi:hypothetical protein
MRLLRASAPSRASSSCASLARRWSAGHPTCSTSMRSADLSLMFVPRFRSQLLGIQLVLCVCRRSTGASMCCSSRPACTCASPWCTPLTASSSASSATWPRPQPSLSPTHPPRHVLLYLVCPSSFNLVREQTSGSGAIYGTSQQIPDRSLISDICCGFLDVALRVSTNTK